MKSKELTTLDEEIELSSDIVELLDSYDSNCKNVEKKALDFVASSEISVFNLLRNLSFQDCLKALDRINTWYVGDTDFIERFVCLAVLTEYICIAYYNTHLYETFHVALSTKFKEQLFKKLCQRWSEVFENEKLSTFMNNAEFVACFKILKQSAERVPLSFFYKYKLRDTIRQGEEMLSIIEERRNQQKMSSEKPLPTTPANKSTTASKQHAKNLVRSVSKITKANVARPKISSTDSQLESINRVASGMDVASSNTSSIPAKARLTENLVQPVSRLGTPTASTDKILQNSMLINVDWKPIIVIHRLKSVEDLELCKKKMKQNAFDILMRKKKPQNCQKF